MLPQSKVSTLLIQTKTKKHIYINKIKIENSQLKRKVKELTKAIATMANIELKVVIPCISVFSGKMEEFDAFINTCAMMTTLVNEANKPHLLTIMKAKISGEALAKVRPLDTIASWNALSKRLHERLKKPMTFEYAQADLSNVFQKPSKSLEEYSKRVNEKFRRLNEASKSIPNVDAEVAILRKANEKLAITKFQQNLRNETLKVLVSAAVKNSLDDIQFALEREMLQNTGNLKACNFCNKKNHTEDQCNAKA